MTDGAVILHGDILACGLDIVVQLVDLAGVALHLIIFKVFIEALARPHILAHRVPHSALFLQCLQRLDGHLVLCRFLLLLLLLLYYHRLLLLRLWLWLRVFLFDNHWLGFGDLLSLNYRV